MKQVIFDLDGTLVDSRKGIVNSINHVRREIYGLPPLDEEVVVRLMNGLKADLAQEFYGVETYEERARELFEHHYAGECLHHARCYPGFVPMLERLRDASCRLFVATNAPTHTSELILRNCHIEGFFDDIIGADRVRKPKPEPDMLLHILQKSRASGSWMVGDSLKDVMAAKAAGIAPIFVTWGYSPEKLRDERIERHAGNPGEVVEIVFK
jgi:HAD superfamily hydrolase (TIGR01549 family)